MHYICIITTVVFWICVRVEVYLRVGRVPYIYLSKNVEYIEVMRAGLEYIEVMGVGSLMKNRKLRNSQIKNGVKGWICASSYFRVFRATMVKRMV